MAFVDETGCVQAVPRILSGFHNIFDGGLHLVHDPPFPQLVGFNRPIAERDYVIDHTRVGNDAIEGSTGCTVGPGHMRQGAIPFIHQRLARFLVGMLRQPLQELVKQGRGTHDFMPVRIHEGHEDLALFFAEHAPCRWEQRVPRCD